LPPSSPARLARVLEEIADIPEYDGPIEEQATPDPDPETQPEPPPPVATAADVTQPAPVAVVAEPGTDAVDYPVRARGLDKRTVLLVALAVVAVVGGLLLVLGWAS
jgi:hypothetical protein